MRDSPYEKLWELSQRPKDERGRDVYLRARRARGERWGWEGDGWFWKNEAERAPFIAEAEAEDAAASHLARVL